jgi:hypothetical protein
MELHANTMPCVRSSLREFSHSIVIKTGVKSLELALVTAQTRIDRSEHASATRSAVASAGTSREFASFELLDDNPSGEG